MLEHMLARSCTRRGRNGGVWSQQDVEVIEKKGWGHCTVIVYIILYVSVYSILIQPVFWRYRYFIYQ